MKIRLTVALRVLGFVLGGMATVLAALTLLVWIGFDADRTTAELTRHFKTRYQRTLVLGGEPQLHIWPHPALTLRDVSLSEAGRAGDFAKVGQVRVDLATMPLLFRQFEVRGISASGVDLAVRRSRTGEWNFADFLAAPPANAPWLSWQVNPRELHVRDVRVRYEDAAGRQIDWQKVAFNVVGLNAGSPASLDWQGQWGEAATHTEFRFAGSARFEADEHLVRGSLHDLDLALEGSGGGLTGATAKVGSAALEWSDQGAAGRFERLDIKVQGAAGQRAMSAVASAQSLGWQGMQLRGTQIEVQETLRAGGSQTRFRTSAPELAEMPNGFSVADLGVSLEYRDGSDKAVNGKFAARLEADVRGGGYALSGIKAAMTARHPRLHAPQVQIGLSGRAGWKADGTADCALDWLLGKDHVQLSAQLKKLWPANGRVDVSARTLDLDALLASASDKPSGREALALESLAVNGRVAIGSLHAGGVQIANLQLPYRVEEGDLDAEGVSADLYGGKITGSVSVESDTGKAVASGDFHDIAFDRLVRDASLKIPLGGRASGSYRLSADLKGDADPLASLAGAVRWTMADASLRGVDLVRSLHALRPAIEAGKQSARTPGEAESTDLGVASSRFVFADGMMRTDGFQTHNGWLTLSGAGSASLVRDEMDFNLIASLLPGIGSSPAKDLAGLRGKPLHLRLKGVRLHPDVRFEPVAVAPVVTARPAAAVKKK